MLGEDAMTVMMRQRLGGGSNKLMNPTYLLSWVARFETCNCYGCHLERERRRLAG